MSTIIARQAACTTVMRHFYSEVPALMAKSSRYTLITAIHTIRVWYESDSTRKNHDPISLVQPMIIKLIPTMTDPATMNGRRRPIVSLKIGRKSYPIAVVIGLRLPLREVASQDLRVRTERTQINVPDKGPASHTRDICALDRPRESKYGVPSC